MEVHMYCICMTFGTALGADRSLMPIRMDGSEKQLTITDFRENR